MEWVSVKDILPEENELVDVFSKSNGRKTDFFLRIISEETYFFESEVYGDIIVKDATH